MMNTKIRDHEYVVSAWFERDRSSLALSTPKGREIFRLVDDDLTDAIESGYLPTPRRPRPAEADWQSCAVSYARSMGLIK